MIDNATEFLDIDLNNLEYELRRQAQLFHSVYSEYVKKSSMYDQICEELNVKESEKSLAFRLEQKQKSEKVTEKMVDEYLTLSPELQTLRADKIAAKTDRELLFSLVKALEHKREALKSVAFTSRNEVLPEE